MQGSLQLKHLGYIFHHVIKFHDFFLWLAASLIDKLIKFTAIVMHLFCKRVDKQVRIN